MSENSIFIHYIKFICIKNMGRWACKEVILYVVPVNSHFAGVWFSEFPAGDDLKESDQLAAVGDVGEKVVELHLGLQQEAAHPFCESLPLDVKPLLLQCSEERHGFCSEPNKVSKIKMSKTRSKSE